MKGEFMELFEFLKKNRSDPPSAPTTTDKPGERTSVFKGDLAFIQDTDVTPKKEPSSTEYTPTHYTGENKDSADSVVYMSFAPAVRNIWICSECGTRNDEGLSGCIVCGLKK